MLQVIRAILNACCLQLCATIIQLVCTLLIACLLGLIFAYYVAWRAAGYLFIISIGYDLAVALEVIVLCCYNWDKIQQNVILNTTQVEQQCADNLLSTMNSLSLKIKIFLLLRSGGARVKRAVGPGTPQMGPITQTYLHFKNLIQLYYKN